jgi:ABC-2 type transport system permease protein
VPIVQLLLFGFAINNDPKALPTALIALDQGALARSVASALETSGYFRIMARPTTAEEGERLMASGAVSFLITIPGDFGVRVERGEVPAILAEADASDPAAASGAIGALSTIAATALDREATIIGAPASAPFSIVVQKRYNPEGISQYNIVPGLLGVILQMTMVMMTAMALTREIERGTMENLLAMPATPLETMLGKVLPYFVVGGVQVAVILVTAKLLFAVPFVGGLALLCFAILLFVFALVLLGYTISTFSRTQMQAMQLTFFFFLPSLLLSGFMFPFLGMPGWAQTLGEIFPLTHFLRIVRGIMLKGADLAAVSQELAVLGIFIAVFASLALLRFRRTLD